MGSSDGNSKHYSFLSSRYFLIFSLNFRFWKIMFTLVVPVILAVVIVYGWVDHEKLSYEGKDFPPAVEGFGWAIEVGKFLKGLT